MKNSSFYPEYSYTTIDELKEKARKAAEKAGKKGQKYEPVTVKTTGRKLCSSWWGQSWCENLEWYSDFANRLPRGKRYVRAGAVIDLKIGKGVVKAKVQGSRARPYSVTIHIDPLSKKDAAALEERCEFEIQSLEELISGKFPDSMKDLFTQKGGLFPTPGQIHFDCSCPDWAFMCKHVAAVMYAIGVRLDENPFLFFELRNIDPQLLVQKAISNRLEAMLQHANRPSRRILHEDTDALFGL